MNTDWRLEWGFPLLAKMPGLSPWALAPCMGRDSLAVRRATADFLVQKFAAAFPDSSPESRCLWAKKHLQMIAVEMLDSINFHRFDGVRGPKINLQGWPVVERLRLEKKGFILILNHYDRLILAAIALAKMGVDVNIVTMPVVDNPGLSPTQRNFIVNKISNILKLTRGEWRVATDSLRPVYQSLRSGGVWVILADAWSPDFLRMRTHPFLGGFLNLPTGIERIADATGVDLLHGVVCTESTGAVNVVIEALPKNSEQALNKVIQRLECDVKNRPWAWWHWGMWEQMWRQNL